MAVFVLFLMYQEHQMTKVALEAQDQVERVADGTAVNGDRGESTMESPPVVRDSAAQIDDSAAVAQRIEAPDGAGQTPTEPGPVARQIPIVKTTLQNEDVVAEISNLPAMITSWRLKSYLERLPEGEESIELIDPNFPALRTAIVGVAGADFGSNRFEVLHSNDREVLQRAQNSAGVLTRRIRLDGRGYGFDVELTFESRRGDPVDARFELIWPAEMSDRPDFRELSLIAYSEAEGVEREAVVSVAQPWLFGIGGSSDGITRVEGNAIWGGIDLRYFVGVLIDPADRGGFDVQFESLTKGESAEARLATRPAAIGSGGSMGQALRGYIGPKVIEDLAEAGSGLEYSVNRGYSWIEPLVKLFEIALTKLYAVIPNYGVAIIILTILVRILVSPLMVKQMRSAEKMRVVQPKVKALQEKYKDDKQKQSEEMMKLWKEEGINPLSGCVPLLFQFPVLIGLFFALQSSIGLRHAPFVLWINDLSQPATIATIPGLDFPIRILPLIMAGSMFLQQKMTPSTGMDPAQAKMMLFMMPGMMLLFSYTFPSGLVLYWTVSNILGIAHQYWIRSKMQPAS
jgi:YidC/Oxa1 family membrane protein insertase